MVAFRLSGFQAFRLSGFQINDAPFIVLLMQMFSYKIIVISFTTKETFFSFAVVSVSIAGTFILGKCHFKL